MKLILKKIYMLFFHFIFLLKVKPGKNCFISGKVELYNRKGGELQIGDNFRVGDGTKFKFYNNSLCKIGNDCFLGSNITFLIADKLQLGNNVLMASNIFITTENHGINPELSSFSAQELTYKSVTIGNNVWVGENVIILPGVTIGNNVIIGAGSVVTKNISDFSIAVGNPCKIIKKWDALKHEWYIV